MKTLMIESPIGELTALFDENALKAVVFAGNCGCAGERVLGLVDAELTDADPHGLRERFAAYFAGDGSAFEGLVLDAGGTVFQESVWEVMRGIGFGEVITYAEVANRLGKDGAKYGRAVGAASGANPIPVITPCHRVVGSDGSLTGFGGGMETKRWLLEHEGAMSEALVSG